MSTLSKVTKSGTVSGAGRKSTLAQLAESGYSMKSALNPNGSTLQKMFSGTFDSPARANNQGSGLLYTIERAGLGAFSMLEGIWDYTAGGIAKIFGADEWAEAQIANNISGRALNDITEAYNPSKAMQVVGDIAGGVGNSVPAMAAVAAAGAIAYFSGGTLSSVSAGIIAGVTAGLGAAGMGVTSAYEKTGELGGKEFLYGTISGITEGALEGLTGAAGKVGAKLFAKQTAKTLAKKGIVKGIISNFAGEAFEEGMSEFLDPYYQRWTKVDPNAENATAQQIGYAALIGGISGALMGGIGDVYGTAKQIVRGSHIAQNSTLTQSTLDTARSFAKYETEHATGSEAYQYVSNLVNQYDAAKPRTDGSLSIAQKRILGQMEAANTVLTFEPIIQRSRANILANAESFVKAINERGVVDASTGKPFHFNSVEEFTNNKSLVTQFAVADALGQLVMSKDSVYDAVSNQRAGEIMQADFRNFQKEATPQQKKSINDLFGIDVDSITYDDFVDKIQTTNSEVLTSKKAELSAMLAAKKEIARVINTNEAVADANTITDKTAFKDGISVFKVSEKTYAGISKTADGKYMLYLDGNISHVLTKTELVNAIKALITPQSAATNAKTTKKQADFGEKIGGARKDEWAARGLTSADMEGMNAREIQKYAKKERVWKRPNWEQAVADGGDRGLLYAQNEIYKSLNATPSSAFSYRNKSEADILAAARLYADEITEIRKMAENAKTAEDFKDMGTKWITEKGYAELKYGRLTWTDKYYRSPALYGSNYLVAVDKMAQRFNILGERALMEGFGVPSDSKLPRGYEIRKTADSFYGSKAETGNYYIVKSGYRVAVGFNTIEEAIAYGKEHFGSATAAAKAGKQRYVPEQLSEVHREGLDYRQGRDIAGDDYIRDFGIKGGEFGNWLSELDRKTSLNYGYDAFCDLADALGMEKTDISLNGTLNIGFGSRGQGLTGAAAHYEPLRKVINLTKMNGAGSLAHEWWHAFEDYISGDTNQSEMSSNFSKLPKNTRAAATELVNTMLYRDGTVEENALASQKQADRYQQRLKYYLDNNFAVLNGKMSKETMQNYVNQKYYKRMATEADFKRFAELTEQARKGDAQALAKFYDNKRSVVDDLSDLKKEITGKGLAKEDRLALAHAVQDAGLTPDVKVKEKTEYYKDALKISATHSKDGGYWESNCEMLARAFASYITDKTAKSNDYLSGHSEGAVLADGTVAYIMPRGEERTRINAAFDKLFAAAKEDGLIHENTSEKPKNKSRYALSEQAELNSQPAGNKSQTLKPLEMKRAEIYARNNVKGYENLSYGEKLEVEWTIASGWRYGVDNVKIKQMAQIAADIGTGIGFANISAKSSDGKAKAVDGVCYSRSGHNTIYLSPDSVNSVEKITLEELAHAFEGTEGYSDIAKMATEYYDARPAEKAKIENAYKELYKNEEALFAEEILPSELTAHYVREMLGNRNMLAKLTAEKPTFIQRCLNWLKGFKKKAAAVDTAVAADVQILENRFKALYNQNKGKIANGIANTSRMSIASIDGKDTVIVDTDQHIFDGVQREELGNVARKYIQERFRGKTIDGTTYSRISEKEYTHSKDTQRLFNQSGSGYSAKMRASTELINLVKTGELIGHESAKHTKPVNAGGFNRYNVSFILDGKTFKGELLIAQGSNNVATFYDIVKIKESNSTSNNTQVAGRSNALSDNSISKNNEKVNKKYALSSKMDSEGRVLSAEQQKYFADSKITDNDGNLLVVYHGTNNDFYTFDSGRVGKGIDQFGSGYYFTTNKDHAGAYGNRTIEGYLNLKNPFIIEVGDNGGTIDQFYRQPVTQSQAEKILKMHPDIYSTEDSPLGNYSERYWTEGATESVIKEVAAQMNEIGMFTDNTMFGYYPNELNAAIKKVLGYDGIQVNYGKYEKYYIAWEQNQIKDVTNTSPTTAADIRYALSEEQQAKLDSTKGADKVMTELPNSRVSVKDVITKEATKEQFAEQVKSDTKQYKEGFQIAMTNAQAGVERVMREVGVQDATAVTNYVRAGKNAGMNALDIEGAQFSLDGETRLGESWGKIWQPIYALDKKDGQAYAKFQEYLLHYHNIDRMAVGKPVFGENVTAADSRAAIAQIESVYPQFKKIAEKVWKFNDNNLQLSVDSGMYSQEYADHLRELYPHYVPTLREEHAGGIATIQGKNNIRVNNAKKQAIGADTRILPIDDTVAQQTLQKYASARTNKLLVDVLNGKAHDEFRVVSSEDASIDVDTDTLVKTFEDKTKNTHQITFYHDGKRVTVETSRNFYKGIEAFQPSGDSAFNNAILNGAAKLNSAFKKLVTSFNPFFSFFRNPIRDIQDAGLYTRYPLRKFAAAYMEARKQIASNGVYWQEAKAAGITSASVYDYEKGLNYKNMNAIQKAGQKVEAASNAIEMAPRLAEYICSREAGLSVQESLLRAQDVTTNFGRGGIFAKKLNATIMPFLNPAIQGFSKMVRAYTGKDAAQSWINLIVRSVMLGIAATALNDLLHDDDEDYNNLSDYVKENNYVLSFGDGNFLKIPKGRVVSVFGGAYLRSKWYAQGDEDAWEGYLSNIASAVTPVDNFTRTIFSPITDIKTNTTWYGGTIEGQKFANTKPSERYDESTSNIAIWLGKVFNYSPKKIDYLLDQYGGIVTDIVLPATTMQAESGIVSKNLLANSTINSRWSTEFYSQIEKYTYKKTDGDAKAKATVKYLNSIKSTISDMYTQKRQIQTNTALSKDERLSQTQIIQAAINALMKDSLTNAKYLYEELGKYDLSDNNFDMSYLDAISTVVGAEYALKSYNKTVYEKAANLNKLGIGYDTYYDYYFATKSIEADVTSSGKTISGSRKQKLIQYTMSTDLDMVQKLILIMSSGYSISDGDISGVSAKQVKRVVAQYIAKSGLSSEEKTALAKMCGLTVRNGRVYLA